MRSTLRDWIQQSCGQSAYDYTHQTLEQENRGCFGWTDGVQSLALGFCPNGRVMLTVYDPASSQRMTCIIILFDTVADLDKAVACVWQPCVAVHNGPFFCAVQHNVTLGVQHMAVSSTQLYCTDELSLSITLSGLILSACLCSPDPSSELFSSLGVSVHELLLQ